MGKLAARMSRVFGQSKDRQRAPVRTNTWFANPEACQCIGQLLSDGFCVVKQAVPVDVIDKAAAAYQKFKNESLMKHAANVTTGGYEADKFRRVVNLQAAVPEMQRLFSQNKGTDLLDHLFASPATLYTSLTFEIGSGQPPHRDTPYFWTSPGYNYFGLWVALEKTDAENGALQVIPKSHLLPDTELRRREIGLRERSETGRVASTSATLWERYQEAVNTQAQASGLTSIEVHVDKGDAIIWHPQLLHGGVAPKDKNRSRLSVAMHVTPKNTVVFQQDVFFDPDVAVDGHVEIRYVYSDGRAIRVHNEVSIAHEITIPISTQT